jgi:hypothetical protein
VGIHASLRATSTSKALASTIGTLAVLYGYPFYLFAAFWGENLWGIYAAFIGLPSRLVVGPLVSYGEFSGVWRQLTLSGVWSVTEINTIKFGLIVMGFYAVVAAGLTYRAVARFDRWLDRPEMSIDDPGARRKPRPLVELEEVEPLLQS